VETFRDLGDREESDLIAAVTATSATAESSRFRIAVARGFNSRSHASMVPYRWKGTLSLIPYAGLDKGVTSPYLIAILYQRLRFLLWGLQRRRHDR
jgi:hypothetical protein